MKVAVVGGGPAGLVTLKFLTTAHNFFPIPPIEARLFEASGEIGGTFVHRVYEDAELVSSKYLTAFSDYRLPPDAPDFLTPEAYVDYLRGYAAAFNLERFIECRAKVVRVARGKCQKGHVVSVTKPDGQAFDWECDAIAVCCGLNGTPRIPMIRGIERVPVVLHSSQVKNREQFGHGTNVVVLGVGETGMDMAHLAITSPTNSVTVCHRDGFFCGPKIVPTPIRRGRKPPDRQNKPVDTSVCSLFDTAYTHPVLQRSWLPWFVYDWWVKSIHYLISGTEEGPDQWVGHMSKERKNVDSIFFVKSDRALPYMSDGHRANTWINRLRSAYLNVPIKDTRGRKIDVVRWPTYVDKNGIMNFEEAQSHDAVSRVKQVRPDVVVFATGYQSEFTCLDSSYPKLSHVDIHGIYKEGDVSVGFIGYVRPSIGAIPPLAEMQAQLWVLRLLQCQYPTMVLPGPYPNAVEPYELDYKMHPRAGYDLFSTKRAVDHESYVYQLALDIGSAPTITYIMTRGWRLFFTWAFGSNFNTKFRLVGPWKWQGAEAIMCNELYNVVKETGGMVYFMTYTVFPFILFGTISIFLYAWFGVLDGVEKMVVRTRRQPEIEKGGKQHLG